MSHRVDEEVLHPRPPSGPPLGPVLTAARRRRQWPLKRMAMALDIPYDAYLGIEADAGLPTFAQLQAICGVVDESADQVNRMVMETARKIIRTALRSGERRLVIECWISPEEAELLPPVCPSPNEADELLWANLPAVLRASLADQLRVADEPIALAAALRKLAAAPEHERLLTIDDVVSEMQLEGEREALTSLPWQDDELEDDGDE